MGVRELIDDILADDRLDQEDVEESKVDAIEGLIKQFGWTAVREYMMDMLRDDNRQPHWRTAADVFLGSRSRQKRSCR